METIPTIANFIFTLIQTFFTFIMSSWVTAVFPVGMVILFVLNLVISSGSGSDDNK